MCVCFNSELQTTTTMLDRVAPQIIRTSYHYSCFACEFGLVRASNYIQIRIYVSVCECMCVYLFTLFELRKIRR